MKDMVADYRTYLPFCIYGLVFFPHLFICQLNILVISESILFMVMLFCLLCSFSLRDGVTAEVWHLYKKKPSC